MVSPSIRRIAISGVKGGGTTRKISTNVTGKTTSSPNTVSTTPRTHLLIRLPSPGPDLPRLLPGLRAIPHQCHAPRRLGLSQPVVQAIGGGGHIFGLSGRTRTARCGDRAQGRNPRPAWPRLRLRPACGDRTPDCHWSDGRHRRRCRRPRPKAPNDRTRPSAAPPAAIAGWPRSAPHLHPARRCSRRQRPRRAATVSAAR